MKKIMALLLAAIVLLSLVSCSNNNQSSDSSASQTTVMTSLISNGTSEYSIVIPTDASECIKFASKELADFLYQSSGVQLDVINDNKVVGGKYVSVGKTLLLAASGIQADYNALNLDGYFIKTVDNNIYIDGYLERGTMYGCYAFLEKYVGVRFFTADCTLVPKKDKIEFPVLNIVEAPDFTTRVYLNGDVYANFSDPLFAARTRQDTQLMKNYVSIYGEEPALFLRSGKDHNMHFFVDESIYNDPAKPETYHPEFYQSDPNFETTLCLTNGITDDGELDDGQSISVAKIVIAEMEKDILANPNCKYFGFEQEDGQVYCQCDKCKKAAAKYQRSGVLIRFMNVVNRELKKWAKDINLNREFQLLTFAYSYTFAPPVKEVNGVVSPIDKTVVCDDDIVMRIAFAYDVNQDIFESRKGGYLHNAISQWGLCAKSFMFWVHDKDYYDYLSYFPSFDNIKDNVLKMKEFGVANVLVQAAHNDNYDWQSNLRGYIYRNLLWDTSLSVDKLADEFIDNYWGETAAPYIKQFINAYEMNYAVALKTHPDYEIYTLQTEYVDPTKGCISIGFIRSVINILGEAENAVNSDTKLSYAEKQIFLKRIAMCKTTPYGTLWRNYYKFFPTNDSEQYHEFLVDFLKVANFAGIRYLRETLYLADYEETVGAN